MDPKTTAGLFKVSLEVDAGPHKSVRRMFGEREIVERMGHDVTIRLRRGEEMAFPLPETENLAILRPLGSIDIGIKRAIVEWSFFDPEKGIRPLRNSVLCLPNPYSGRVDCVLHGIHDRNRRLGWTTTISLNGMIAEGTAKEGYVFQMPEDGYVLTHRDGVLVDFKLVDGKLVEDRASVRRVSADPFSKTYH